MCGIVGFSAPGGADETRERLTKMLQPIRHRGPDGEGVWRDENLALGQVRLMVIDPRGGRQPRVDEGSGAALVYNGEIYGYQAQAKTLREQGIVLQDQSDTEVLFQLLKGNGVHNTLQTIDGMFAFAFRAEHNGPLYLARDRFGEKPLFYALREGVLLFASEIKSLLRHPLLAGSDFDQEAVALFLAMEYLPGEGTGLGGIKKLPPGTLLTFHDGEVKCSTWWRPKPGGGDVVSDGSEGGRMEALEVRLAQSVRERLIADVPVGVFLSGGVDSSLIAAFTARETRSVSAFTVQMPGERFDESGPARRVAQHLGLAHEVMAPEEGDLLQALEGFSQGLDAPFADASFLPTWLLCRHAKSRVTVALGGDGADELFAGYPNFPVSRFAGWMQRFPQRSGVALRKLLDRIPPSDGYMGFRFRLGQLSHGWGYGVDHQPFYWLSPFGPSTQKPLWRREVFSVAADGGVGEALDRLLAVGDNSDRLSRLLYLFSVTYLPEDILTKVDRAAMSHSLEVRSPYLGRDFSEYVLRLGGGDKLQGMQTKVLLKKMALKHLPKEIVHRSKHGFALPVSALLRGLFRERVAEVLFDPGSPFRSWFHGEVIEGLWRDHQAGKRDHGKKLWSLYALYRWGVNVRGGGGGDPGR
ncbi:MAG: asparagine synthase (glutamine-hydrolyzing) [Magnetococcales bacterium]|nr:asparagine synthase (glutamine-hydrolyzing) [Magnetococcales bacterium]